MSHSFNKILIHAIWSTKERQPLIVPESEREIHRFMKQQLIDSGCHVLIINGMPDHVHCLFLLNPGRNITEVIKQVKGSTSHYINQQNLIPGKFAWQTGYAAFSVSESVKDKVFEYIRNQKAHHTKQSFQQEFDQILKLYGFNSEPTT